MSYSFDPTNFIKKNNEGVIARECNDRSNPPQRTPFEKRDRFATLVMTPDDRVDHLMAEWMITPLVLVGRDESNKSRHRISQKVLRRVSLTLNPPYLIYSTELMINPKPSIRGEGFIVVARIMCGLSLHRCIFCNPPRRIRARLPHAILSNALIPETVKQNARVLPPTRVL